MDLDDVFAGKADIHEGKIVPAETKRAAEGDAEEKVKELAATALVKIAEELYDFCVSDAGQPFGIPRSGPKVLQMLRGGKTSLRSQLSRHYFRKTGKAARATGARRRPART